jgi:ribonucrease Y
MVGLLGLILAVLGGCLVAGTVFYIIGRRLERSAAAAAGYSAAQQASRAVDEARRAADQERQELVLAGKAELMAVREGWERESAKRREEQDRRESLLDRKFQTLDDRERDVQRRDQEVREREQREKNREADLDRRLTEARSQLERAAGLTAADAKQELLRRIENEARSDAQALVRDLKDEARRTAEREARKIVALAIQRIAADYTAESTTAAVALPNDEMKGRIIGREGRNIRAFEAATGTDVIIDDTPDTVVISCFDPVRREVGRLSLERLIADGRIHPGRIEEVVKQAHQDVEQQIQEAGEQAAYELGLHGMHAELVKLVGRMRFRTSYGQNMLEHSKEVAWLAGMMAAELKLDAVLAKRGALLHDIGKVLTHEHDGTHVQLGIEVATKYGEHPIVINCIAAHHDDVPHETPISVLVQAADAVSGSRPGARREAFETYVKRLTRVEEIGRGFPGVEKVFAIQAGREVRVVVTPDVVDDGKATELAEQIAKRIEHELQYPGQIKVVVIRETRAFGIAR